MKQILIPSGMHEKWRKETFQHDKFYLFFFNTNHHKEMFICRNFDKDSNWFRMVMEMCMYKEWDVDNKSYRKYGYVFPEEHYAPIMTKDDEAHMSMYELSDFEVQAFLIDHI